MRKTTHCDEDQPVQFPRPIHVIAARHGVEWIIVIFEN